MEWNGKAVWECIRDKELTSAPAFKGNLYDSASIKIMYVGHAVNGWEFGVSECKSLEDTLENIMNQDNGLKTLVEKDKYAYQKKNGKTAFYNHINSNFFRLIKHILELQNESDSPLTNDTWYDDSKKWNQKIVWSNLYNIAPRTTGNPNAGFAKMGMLEYTEIFKAQIEEYKPDVVVCCPLSGWFVPWKREPSFDEVLDEYKKCNIDDTIIGIGKLGATDIIVCKRPDVRGKSREDVFEMAKTISKCIDEVRKK